ncbi:MAG: redoxin domain-containing protein [Terriglobales bacterium]
MTKLSKHRALIAGILSPLLALVSYAVVYSILTQISSDRERDWLFRLTVSTLAMTVPLLVTIVFVIKDGRRNSLSLSARVGLVVAILSFGLIWKPVSDGITRWKQARNMAMRDVAAPPFDTLDLDGRPQRLEDQKGKVVLVNIWATWCEPCRAEMPKLDRLYRERKDQGFIVFGLSDENVVVQRKFLERITVTYPLLTIQGQVPNLYRDIARYPAIFLIDRGGKLQPAPNPDQPFEKVEATTDALLKGGS